ncbi:hypothetical protein DEO23_00220 [Brachybacterium endophyticum]|uniref:Uncharacterized protein n=2 Tax=Brachybacterium endophyticum TaxID=2182385 RepID=A0A2U2RMM8_9MICO|nr:hypothetical protein DEO23_00220 [Brachybacterium endophyticum]
MLLTASTTDRAESTSEAREERRYGFFSRPSQTKSQTEDRAEARSGWPELSDPDAEAAIIVLKHLGDTAPSPELNGFILQVMGQVLGVAEDAGDEPAAASPGIEPEAER